MRLHSLFLVSLLAAVAVAAPVALRPRTVACQTGAYIVAARGTFEAQGEGRLANVSAQIDARIAGSVDVALVYPANFIGYADSVVDGVENMAALIQAYVGACPGLPIVLLGYSQVRMSFSGCVWRRAVWKALLICGGRRAHRLSGTR